MNAQIAQAAFTPLDYSIPWNCSVLVAFVLSWQRGSSATELPFPDVLQMRRKVLQGVLMGLLAHINWVPCEGWVMVPVLVLNDLLPRLKSLPRVLPLPPGGWMLGRDATQGSQKAAVRNWKDMALVWSCAVEGQKLNVFVDQHLGRRWFHFLHIQ